MADVNNLQINVGADISNLVTNANAAAIAFDVTTRSVAELNTELTALKAQRLDITDGRQLAEINTQIANTTSEIQRLKNVGQQGFNELGNAVEGTSLSLSKQRIAFTDLGRVITGQGFSLRTFSSNFALVGPQIAIAGFAIYEIIKLLGQQSDAEKKAASDAKALKEELINLKPALEITATSTGSEAGNISRVQALAAAIEDTTKSYKERNNALLELRETNKAYFGDLTLEAGSLATLASRVREYSQALITEAIVKGQVQEIAKISSEYQKQKDILDQLRIAKNKAESNVNANTTSRSIDLGGGSGAGNSAQQDAFNKQLEKATDALGAQKDVVFKLEDQIVDYKKQLDETIASQIKFKPLTSDPHTTDELKKELTVLEQVEKIQKELRNPDKRPIHQRESDSTDPVQIKIFQLKIAEALQNAASDPKTKDAYDQLANLFGQQLHKLQNPDRQSPVRIGLQKVTPDDVQEVESKIEKAFGSKGLDIKVPVNLDLEIKGLDSFYSEDEKLIEEALKKDPGYAKFFVNAPVNVKIQIGKAIINEEEIKKLQNTIQGVVKNVASSGFKDIGIALGDALSGAKNPLQKAIQDFTTVLGDGLIKIGEQMIAASTLMATLKTALGGLFTNPAGGIIEGIAAVALGEVVKNVGAHAFATGGIVTGPTLGLVGEAGPEVIFPLDRLNQFVKGITTPSQRAQQPQSHQFRILGRDLVTTLARANDFKNPVS